jgi:LacI family transcriptional regulator
MAVTQKQIAQHLGLSQPIVAQALNGHPAVAEGTRQRVRDAARAMGYGAHSNSAARSLIARRHGGRYKTGTIAVLMGSFFEGLPLHDVPFFKPLLRGIECEAVERELDVSFCMSSRNQLPRLVVEQGVDGVLSIYSKTMNILLRERQLRLPALCVGDAAPGEWGLLPDNFEGVRLATQHLIDLGHRRIAYLGYLNTDWPEIGDGNRLDGYFQALKDSGIAVANELIDTHLEAPTQEAGAAGMERLLARTRNVTALVCYNDTSALGAIRKAQELGLRVPQDMSVVGFDDTSEEYNFEPRLTTIRFDRVKMGRRAVQLLCEAAEETPPVAADQHELLPIELVQRDSTKQLA